MPSIATASHAARLAPRLAGVIAAAVVAASGAGCSEDSSSARSPGARRGQQVYVANCIACHNQDPAMPGALGPPLKGTPREVLEAKVLRGQYPPGHMPRRPTAIMPPLPALAQDIDALAEFLKN